MSSDLRAILHPPAPPASLQARVLRVLLLSFLPNTITTFTSSQPLFSTPQLCRWIRITLATPENRQPGKLLGPCLLPWPPTRPFLSLRHRRLITRHATGITLSRHRSLPLTQVPFLVVTSLATWVICCTVQTACASHCRRVPAFSSTSSLCSRPSSPCANLKFVRIELEALSYSCDHFPLLR